MNWTSTTVPLWRIDCEEFRKVGRPFDLRDIDTDDHLEFAGTFTSRSYLEFRREQNRIIFHPKPLWSRIMPPGKYEALFRRGVDPISCGL